MSFFRAARLWAVGVVGVFLALAAPRVRATEQAEPPVAGTDRDGDYLRLVHQRLHTNWVDGYLRITPYDQLGPDTSKRQTEINLTVRWDGTIELAEIATPSDVPDFDAAALNAIWSSAPFPPPTDIMADDGLAHIKWRFARDFRQCSGAEVVHVEFPLQIALPNLVARGRLSDALQRMSVELEHTGWTGGDFLSPFVRLWLGRANLSDELDTRAAAALALGGDPKQGNRLRAAVLSPLTAGVAAPALQSLGVNVGSLLAAALSDANAEATRAAVVVAVRALPSITTSCAACVTALAAAALDPRRSVAERVAMLEILGGLERTHVVDMALGAASKDPAVAIRGAALLADMPPGRGRVGVIRMAPLLHDPAPEIRAAAAAGVLRAGGDLGLEQLYLLAREHDSRPLLAAASELGRMNTEASAEFLGKLLKRSDKVVRRGAVQALTARHDEPARALVEPILRAAVTDANEDPAVRALAIPFADPAQLVAMGVDARLGRDTYRALIGANDRQDAARWLLANFERLSPEDRIAVLADWIAAAPKLAARR
ncbi:MAG TPA: HEAT repeat domain-containing protein [Polyangia bacterium]|jgi:hypothetical protein